MAPMGCKKPRNRTADSGFAIMTSINPKNHNQLLPSDPFGCFKCPFQGLSDLHLGYQKVTWKKLEVINDIPVVDF